MTDPRTWLRTYDDFLPLPLCASLRSHVQTSPQSHRIEQDYRRCAVGPIPPGTVLYASVVTYLRRARARYMAEVDHQSNLHHVTHLEHPSVVKYEPTTRDEFRLHADAWSAASALRQLSLIAYLNDVDVGGETVFPLEDAVVQPREGRLVIFPSHLGYPHAAKPPVSGPKYALIAWLTFAPTGETPYASAPLP